MLHTSQEQKYINSVVPIAADNATLTFVELDTKGWSRAQILLILGATDIAMSACKLTHGNTAGSGHADLSGADMDGDTEMDGSTAALPTATDDEKIFAWDIDLRHTDRYIDATITIGDGTAGGVFNVLTILSEPETVPTTVAGKGATSILRL